MTDPRERKASQQRTWSSGDYAMIGSRLVIVSEFLCEAVDLRANHRVLEGGVGARVFPDLDDGLEWCE